MARTEAPSRPTPLVGRWLFAIRTCNPPRGKVDPISRWLVLVRACVLPMTATAVLVAGLLAVREPGFAPGLFALAAAGGILAHCANNLMNDLFDLSTSLDTDQYPRALYAPHPVLSGMITRGGLAAASAFVNVVDLGILVALFLARGWPVVAFAAAGFFVSAGYTMPPVRLKKRGMGEPGVFIVWGPLMVGGTYYAAVGSVPWQVIAASVPYGLLCTAVLMGKHVDKLPWDAPRGIATLPVMLGERVSRRVTQAMMAGFYVSVAALVGVRALPVLSLVAFGALHRLVPVWKVFSRPRPDEPPKGYPIWPLWYAAAAFMHTRRAGALFLAGLGLAALFPSLP